MRTFAVVITLLILVILVVLVRMENQLGNEASAATRSTHHFQKQDLARY